MVEQKLTSISIDKGKNKMDELPLPVAPQSRVDASASTSKILEPPQERPQRQQRQKVFQPKYPFANAQMRQAKQVLVPRILLEEQWLSKGDKYRWVKHYVVDPKNTQVDGSLPICA